MGEGRQGLSSVGSFFFLLRSETGSVEQFYNNSSILLR